MPLVSQGRTIVIAAETGSGKTLAYLAPVASMVLRQKEKIAEKIAAGGDPAPGEE
jgi:superfamily II DNA/RNA helicase